MSDETYVAIGAWLERRLGLVMLIGLLMLASGPLLLLGQWVASKLLGVWPDISITALYRPVLVRGERMQRIVDLLMRQQLATYLFVGSSVFLLLFFFIAKAFDARVAAAKKTLYYARPDRKERSAGR